MNIPDLYLYSVGCITPLYLQLSSLISFQWMTDQYLVETFICSLFTSWKHLMKYYNTFSVMYEANGGGYLTTSSQVHMEKEGIKKQLTQIKAHYLCHHLMECTREGTCIISTYNMKRWLKCLDQSGRYITELFMVLAVPFLL